MKCNEANPFCYQCISTGRQCDGYVPATNARPDLSIEVLGTLSRSPSIEFLGSEKERRSFFFFRHKTASQLSGFFGDDFWERLLLQAALYEPSIRHAILALGSLHARFDERTGLNIQDHTIGWTDDFALRNYNQAINLLVKPLSQGGQQVLDVCLVCSILFACFEVRSFYIQALSMLNFGRQCKGATVLLSHTSKAV